ncbi:hypothetical protein GF325_05975 [Candidatus Bathyarchaeota archaeon]|nr:hypothetical protein [Candidatus Bathyarchaeota archaeon]
MADGKKDSPGRLKGFLDGIKTRMKRTLRKSLDFFVRDFNVKRSQILNLMFKAMILASYGAFWFVSLLDRLPTGMRIDEPMNWIIILVFGITILFGGIITDRLVFIQFVYEIMALVAIVPMLLMLFFKVESIVLLGATLLGFVIALLVLQFFTAILVDTTLLNRARIITFLFAIMGLFSAPIITLVIIVKSYHWVYLIIILLSLISVFSSKKFPRRHPVVSIKKIPGFKVKNYWTMVKSSGVIPHVIFFFFTSMVIGFFFTEALSTSLGIPEIIVIIVVVIASLPIISSILDNRGRKPIVYLTLFLLGAFCIFRDYPASAWESITALRIGLYSFSVILILVLALVISGDLSSHFSRGKISGIITFFTTVGMVTGVFLYLNIDTSTVDVVAISDWASIIIFISIFLFASTPETLQEDTHRWHEFLEKLYLVSDAGLALFSWDFHKDNRDRDEVNEDLVSGGLKGIESLLKEISHSKQNIRVLDHGDMNVIFHYGKCSMAVLFVEKELVILREKLANFHLLFEYINQDALQGDIINLGELKEVNALLKRFFKQEKLF